MHALRLARLAAGLLCAALAGYGAAAAERGELNAIESLDYGTLQAGRIAIRVGLKQPLKDPPSGFRILHPDARIVLEFPGTTVGTAQSTFRIDRGVLRSMHLVQKGAHTRLVISLLRPAPYQTWIEGNALVILIERGAYGAAIERTERFASRTAAPPHRIRDVAFRRGANREGRVVVLLQEPAPAAIFREQGRQLVVDFPDTGIAPEALQRLDVLDFATPIASITTSAEGNNVRLLIEPMEPYQVAAYQAGAELVVVLTPWPQQR
jgi:type IV pilus assembly protein PilQ